jgi:hypothetical protein
VPRPRERARARDGVMPGRAERRGAAAAGAGTGAGRRNAVSAARRPGARGAGRRPRTGRCDAVQGGATRCRGRGRGSGHGRAGRFSAVGTRRCGAVRGEVTRARPTDDSVPVDTRRRDARAGGSDAVPRARARARAGRFSARGNGPTRCRADAAQRGASWGRVNGPPLAGPAGASSLARNSAVPQTLPVPVPIN